MAALQKVDPVGLTGFALETLSPNSTGLAFIHPIYARHKCRNVCTKLIEKYQSIIVVGQEGDILLIAPQLAESRGAANLYEPSDDLLVSNDAEASVYGNVYLKGKETMLTTILGVLRTKFDLRLSSQPGGYYAYGRVYVDGTPVGTERSTALTTYVTFTEDISYGSVSYKMAQLWMKTSSGTLYAYGRNFRMYGKLQTAPASPIS